MSGAYKKALVLMAAAAVLVTGVVGCGRSSVAKVNGRKITQQEYYSRLERVIVNSGPQGQAEAGLLVIRDLINEELLLGLAEKESVAPTDEQVEKRFNEAQKQPGFAARLRASGITKDQARDLMKVQQAHFNLVTRGVKVADKECLDYYNKNKATVFTQPEYARVAGIFAESDAAVKEITDLLKKGVAFSTVAMNKSSDRASGQEGGVLRRPIMRGDPDVPKDVQDKVLSTPKGKYTDPIKGGNGYVIFRVLEKRPKRVQPFNDVKYNIWTNLMIERGGKKNNIDELLEKYRNSADIQVGIDRYKEFFAPPKEQAPKKK